jgi:glutamate synthase (NADPH) small chain
MGKTTGFMEYTRETPQRRPISERVNDWFEVYEPFPEEKVQRQAARCMDCGVPFCNGGCPVNNLIPDWNDLVYKNRWREAVRALHAAINFPEITGRVCPAVCEAACVLGINEPPVAIKAIEKDIVEHAFAEGWIVPQEPQRRTGKKIAVIGSGPAGLAAAQQLARAGHAVTVFEKNGRVGGLLRYGIPDFKLEKHIIDRRLHQMGCEDVRFRPGVHVGKDISADELAHGFDATLVSIGVGLPRDIKVPGRQLRGIHFAMDYLAQQNRRFSGEHIAREEEIIATGKQVVVIGGGDTGADCLGTALRQKAASVHQLEVLPKPPLHRSPSTPWPMWPIQLRTESAHEEGGVREWSVSTTHFEGDSEGNLKRLHAVRVGPPPAFEPVPGSEFQLEADLVLLALGFLGPVKTGLIEQLGLDLDGRGNIKADPQYMTSRPGVFAAGDARRGQSLVVWAITEGRRAAHHIDRYLMGESWLPL